MNCESFNSVLETCDPDELSAAQKRDIERHLASCHECREAWAVYDELVKEPIPATPPDMHRRIFKALDEQEPSDPGRVRRSIITGGALVIGAALATKLTFGLGEPRARLS
jgi:hypothetical protein